MPRNHICIYITALAISLSACLPTTAHAQRKKTIQQEQADTIPLFRNVAVSIDAVGIVQDLTGNYGQYEGAVRVNLKDRYFPVIEAGVGRGDKENHFTKIRYKTSAPYGKIGCDFNILKDKHDIYRLYAGGRYALTSFKYDIDNISITDPIWKGQSEYGAKDQKCTYHWVEALIGLDAKIWGPVRLGWSVRYRSRVVKKYDDMGKPWYVPGYGRTDTSPLGATFNIGVEF